MPFQTFPAEINFKRLHGILYSLKYRFYRTLNLMIIADLFCSQQPRRAVRHYIDPSQYKAQRAQRLAWFRDLAAICKAWMDPIRAQFWTQVTLFTRLELIAFTRAVEGPYAKPGCIRRFYFRFPSDFDRGHTLDINSVVE